MSFFSTISSLQSPLILLLIIFGPSLLPRIITFFRPKLPSPVPQPVQPPKPLTLKLLLGIHTLWIIKQLILPPYNLFVNNNLPISISNAQIRYIILGPESHLVQNIPPLSELLLTRLKVMENRVSYMKFGHQPLTECMWCQSETDFLIYSLPQILGWYILEATFLGILGWRWIAGQGAQARADRWRSTFGWTLVGATAMEVGVKWIWDLRVIEGDALHLASIILTIRSIFLLSLPIIYTLLPLPSNSISPMTLAPIISNTTSTMRLTSLARAAIQRSSRLRETYAAIGRRDAERSEIANRDIEVRNLIKELQLDEGMMRQSAQGWIREGWNGMVRIDPNHRQAT